MCEVWCRRHNTSTSQLGTDMGRPRTHNVVLTSEDNMINNVEYHAGMGLSDHIVMTCVQTPTYTRLGFTSGHTDSRRRMVPIFFNTERADKATHTEISSQEGQTTRETTAKHKRKQQAWKRYRQSGDRTDYIRATVEKNEFTTLTQNLCQTFERKLADNLKENPKDFWRYRICPYISRGIYPRTKYYTDNLSYTRV